MLEMFMISFPNFSSLLGNIKEETKYFNYFLYCQDYCLE